MGTLTQKNFREFIHYKKYAFVEEKDFYGIQIEDKNPLMQPRLRLDQSSTK